MEDNTTITQDLVAAKLAEFGITDDAVIANIKAQGVNTPDQLTVLKEDELIGAGLNKVQARQLLASFVKPAITEPSPVSGPVSYDGILPSVPDDGPWLLDLKAGGVLKVDRSTVISAIRAALANKVGLFDLPGKLVAAMEKFADANDEQVDPIFFKLRKQLTRRAYADIFEAIEGFEASYVTDARKKQLFDRINQYLWPAIISFNEQLRTWYDAWKSQVADPTILLGAFAAISRGHGIAPDVQVPDTGVLHDQADAVNDAINKVFAGSGVQVASAMAFDATQIRKVLMEETRLPALIGAANRDQMLKMLNASVSPTYPRLETNLTRYVLSIFQVKDQPSGMEELDYFKALYLLGSQIPWDNLGGHGIAGIGGGQVQL